MDTKIAKAQNLGSSLPDYSFRAKGQLKQQMEIIFCQSSNWAMGPTPSYIDQYLLS